MMKFFRFAGNLAAVLSLLVRDGLSLVTFVAMNDATVTTWPSIPLNVQEIQIRLCQNFKVVPALAAANRSSLLKLWLNTDPIFKINETWLQNSPNIETIRIFDTKLTTVPAFNCGPAGSEGCMKITAIKLNNNLITYVPTKSFVNHPKLETIILYDNRIIGLGNLWIHNCPSIKIISMAKNNITGFRISNQSEYRALKSLETLRLFDCNVSYLDPDFLRFFPNLTNLYLSQNPIVILPRFIAYHSTSIDVESMTNFMCNCDTVKFAQNGKLSTSDEVGFCGSPEYNVGKSFSQLECRGFNLSNFSDDSPVNDLSDSDGSTCLQLPSVYRIKVPDKFMQISMKIYHRNVDCDRSLDVAAAFSATQCNLTFACQRIEDCQFICLCPKHDARMCGELVVSARPGHGQLCELSVLVDE